MTRVVAYVPDLMDRSRVAAAAKATTFVNDLAELPAAAAGADVVIVDLTRDGVIEMVTTLGGPVIGFANHTERPLMDAARAAGCTTVLARSAFFSRLSGLLTHPDDHSAAGS